MATYQIIEKVGQGGMGVVYRALQTSLGREVALKLLIDDAGPPKDQELARFAREVRAIARISHPNVIRILDYGKLEGRPFYAMDYLGSAFPLNQVVRAGPMPIGTAIALARQLLDALWCLHRAGLIHRDLKPGNVMIDAAGHVTLMDFGLVKDLEASALTRTGSLVGTPRYLSPEIIQGQTIDARSDLFALGALLHEALTGKVLFNAENLAALSMQIVTAPAPALRAARPEIPLWLADLVSALLAKKPEGRPATAADALATLRTALGEPATAPEPPPSRPSRPGNDNEPLAESSVQGGLDALRAHLASSGPAPDPTPKSLHAPPADVAAPPPTPPAGMPARRTTRRTAIPPPSRPPPPPSNAPRAIAAVAGFAVLLLAVLLRPTAPPPVKPSPSPSPVASATPAASAAPATPLELASTALSSLRTLAPPSRLLEIRAALKPLRGQWFRSPPTAPMLKLRQGFTEQLVARMKALGLPEQLAAVTAERKALFTGSAVSPEVRNGLYRALLELEDLEIYCEGFGIDVPRRARAAIWPAYAQVTRGDLAASPAIGFAFRDSVDGQPREMPSNPHSGKWHMTVTDTPIRFHDEATPEASDMMRTLGEGVQRNLAYESPPLDLDLTNVDALELSGWAAELWPNCAFDIELNDGSAWRFVARIRGEHAEPAHFWHPVERGLFRGATLRLRVRFHLLPDLSTAREYASMHRVLLHYRRR